MADPATLDRELDSTFCRLKHDMMNDAYSFHEVEKMGPFLCHSEPMAAPTRSFPRLTMRSATAPGLVALIIILELVSKCVPAGGLRYSLKPLVLWN